MFDSGFGSGILYLLLSCWTQSKLPCGLSRATLLTLKVKILSSCCLSEQGTVILCSDQANNNTVRMHYGHGAWKECGRGECRPPIVFSYPLVAIETDGGVWRLALVRGNKKKSIFAHSVGHTNKANSVGQSTVVSIIWEKTGWCCELKWVKESIAVLFLFFF